MGMWLFLTGWTILSAFLGACAYVYWQNYWMATRSLEMGHCECCVRGRGRRLANVVDVPTCLGCTCCDEDAPCRKPESLYGAADGVKSL